MKPLTKQTYLLYWQHARKYSFWLFVTVAGVVIASVLEVIIPLYFKEFFEALVRGAQGRDLYANVLLQILFIIIALRVISWAFWRVSTFVIAHLQSRVMSDLLNTAFENLQNHSYYFFANRFVGTLVRRAGRLSDSFEGIADRVYYDFLPLIVKIIAIVFVLFLSSKLVAFITIAWTIMYLAINYFFIIYSIKYDEKSSAMDSIVSGQLADTLTNNTNVKLFTGIKYEISQFVKLTEEQFRLRRFAWWLAESSEAVRAGLMVILEFVIFYFAISLWQSGQIGVGDFVLIQSYLIDLFGRLWGFARAMRNMFRYLANAEEMVEIINTPHGIIDKSRAKKLKVTNGEVEFRDVTFAYNQTRDVINHLNLKIKPGEKVGVVGLSGSGKTTIASLILRLFDIQDGAILIDGQNIADVTQDSLHSSISFVPQDPILFHRTLWENIRYGKRDAKDKEVIQAARDAYCDEFVETLPEKYQTYVGERGIKLSGGQRQRIAIARAFLKNASVLILDEATSSLDSHSEQIIQQALERLMQGQPSQNASAGTKVLADETAGQGRTTIVIAHRLSTISKMDRIVVLDNGKVVEQGTHAELIANPDSIYTKLWNLQVGGFISAGETEE
ncbi:MAG: ABC transporter ATP-binding protein [Candidatus Spechtbacteria bacterium]|nr:ABC transporter ATP-binding protein [Candidatus Spechtbacteria bacterium]